MMGYISSTDREKIIAVLLQIRNAIEQLQEWNANKETVDDFLKSSDGMKDLAASCMLVEAIGEGFKIIDKLSDGKLLVERPEIPWKDVKGIRDKIAHGYFDIDADIIYESVKSDLPELLPAVDYFVSRMNGDD